MNTRIRTLAVFLICALATAWAVQAATHALRAKPPATMAAMVPQGALLTIESPDFASLLNAWSTSAECKSWLASDNYAVFSNSRLLGRLTDAEASFDATAFAKEAPDSSAFLKQIAGKQSIFAWYDVGNLEFLYITRMSAQQQAQSALLAEKTHFKRRESAGQPFFVRTSTDSPSRTVAFATVGDLLLLSTREDLMAGALALIQKQGSPVADEPWYTEATAAMPAGGTPDLHMVLNLDRLVPLPAFRSYWVQQNVTQMKQYRAAVSDLYREQGHFREERAILLRDPAPDAATPDLAALAEIAPANGVFRATATSDPAAAITAIEDKLLGREHLAKSITEQAPDADLSTPQQGSATDLDTRIDTPPPVSATFSNHALSIVLKTAGLDATLTFSAAQPPATPAGLWVPIHSAVALHATGTWNPETLKSALQQSLRGTLTTGTLGIEFHPDGKIFALTGPKPLYLAIDGQTALLADDETLLKALLNPPAPAKPDPATLIAGFNQTAQRAPYARLTSLIDGTNPKPAADASPDDHATPAFFSNNIRSLSDSFATLASERITEHRTPTGLHQTVTYTWSTP